jgi:hypothetical protein
MLNIFQRKRYWQEKEWKNGQRGKNFHFRVWEFASAGVSRAPEKNLPGSTARKSCRIKRLPGGPLQHPSAGMIF